MPIGDYCKPYTETPARCSNDSSVHIGRKRVLRKRKNKRSSRLFL